MKYFFALILLGVVITGTILVIRPHSDTPHTSQTTVITPSLEEKVGQMLIVGFRGTSVTANSAIVHEINDLHLAGVILYDVDSVSGGERNIVGRTQLTNLISELKSLTRPDLIVSIDLEGGAINRLKSKYGFINFPSADSLGKTGDLAHTQTIAEEIGTELASVGITMDFAPDTDVNVNPSNPIIGALGRSFSSDPDDVALEAKAFIDGLHTEKILSVIKHFPGHGSSTTDSHLGFVDITKTYQQKELLPFQKLKNDADAIMVAHVTNTAIDPNYPASLSPAFIQTILHGDLGYTGVVISDDISMGAIAKNYTQEDAVVRAVNAGEDMLIVSNNVGTYNEGLPAKIDSIILSAVRSGAIPESTIDAAYARIQAMKNKSSNSSTTPRTSS